MRVCGGVRKGRDREGEERGRSREIVWKAESGRESSSP